MAMSNSSSMTDSPNSSESLNGLAIGHKIYFEDAGVGLGGAMPKSGGVVGAAYGLQSPTKKMRGGSGVGQGGRNQQQQPPRCQVEGCNVDLSDVKAYYARHKVCIMHSKSAVVTVGGVQKRFCQQCSRFHQLPEFDHEKRSCRRRLRGHNERRRKPPPVSLLSSHYGSMASSIFENNQGRGFLLDFSKNSGFPDMDQHGRSADRRSMQQTQVIGKFLSQPWAGDSKNPTPDQFYHNSGGGTSVPFHGIPPGEYYTGGVSSDSSCALSLLSNEPWGSTRNRPASDIGLLHNNSMIVESANNSGINQYPNSSWGFNGNEAGVITHKMSVESDLGFGQIPPHNTNMYYGGGHVVDQHNGRQNVGGEFSSKTYGSAQHMHWSR